MKYLSGIMKIQKILKSLIIIIFVLFIITELSNAATYVSYRSPYSSTNNSISSADEEMINTWMVIIGGIYAWWYFNRDKSKR